jgi:peptidoglycan/LPS O-acetylase OafA/YrhL
MADVVTAPPAAIVRRRPALDGMRAIAVTFVVVYHLDDQLLPGGFVGVDLFFVLPGYLITALLVRERAAEGAISLRGFWRRRVRRLWPLAWVVLALVAGAGVFGVWNPDQQRALPAETAASLANVANWWQAAHGGYVEQFVAPSPLRHFWSLAVEEQFYLLWPIVLAGLLAVAVRRGPRVVWGALAAMSAASIALAWIETPDRAYLGTDTRAVALLAGAALAYGFRGHHLRGPTSPGARRAIGAWALAGCAVVGYVLVAATPASEWLHHGGFAVIAVAGTGLVASVLTNAPVQRALRGAALVWLGRRSYAVYLLHWPLIVALGPERSTAFKAAVVIPVSLLGAELFHRRLELPAIAGRWRPRVLSIAGVVLVVAMAGALFVARPEGPTAVDQVAETLDTVPDPTTTTTQPCIPSTIVAPQFGGAIEFDPRTVVTVADPTHSCADQVRVMVVGDSMGRGVSNGLVALGDPRLEVWDRTVTGCSFGPEECPDWREIWSVDVLGLEPDVVLLYTNLQEDLKGVDDAPYLSAEGRQQRIDALTEAVRILSSGGAKVMLITPGVPVRPNGLYYCDNKKTDSKCDPAWVQEWASDVQQVAAATGAGVIDVAGWLAARSATEATDRPDGLHLSGDALREHAAWLVPQLVAAGTGVAVEPTPSSTAPTTTTTTAPAR